MLQVLPILLPWRRITPATHGQLWNIGPAHRPHRTVLDDVPTTTDLMLPKQARARYVPDRAALRDGFASLDPAPT